MNSQDTPTQTSRQVSLDDVEPRWFAVYTRYKREKMVDRRLRDKGIEVYLPLRHVTRHYTRKVKQLELPLISCYIFAKIVKHEYVPVLEDPDVVQFIRFNRELIAIPQEEIDIIRRVVGEELEGLQVEPRSYRVGDTVEIIGGDLTGLRGRLIDKDGSKLFLVALERTGLDLQWRVDPKFLRRVPGRQSGLY